MGGGDADTRAGERARRANASERSGRCEIEPPTWPKLLRHTMALWWHGWLVCLFPTQKEAPSVSRTTPLPPEASPRFHPCICISPLIHAVLDSRRFRTCSQAHMCPRQGTCDPYQLSFRYQVWSSCPRFSARFATPCPLYPGSYLGTAFSQPILSLSFHGQSQRSNARGRMSG